MIKKNQGYTIIELIFYIAFFALLSLAVINSMIVMTRAFRETNIYSDLLGAGNIMERMAREARKAYSINTISQSSLTLNTTDSGGASTTVQFSLNGANVEFRQGGVLQGNLNVPTLSVNALSFTEITTNKGKAVKILLTAESNNDAQNRAETFYDTVVLRGDYD